MSTIDIKRLIKELTLEEKAGLCSGEDFWHTKAVERLGLPPVMVSDGPHGLRKIARRQDRIDQSESVKAVCFPTASALACSFDRDLLYSLGCALGEECQSEKVSTLLGPAVNMKRSPLCGRNFEYFSEDPYLAGELAANYVNGVQSKKVGTSLKHYAANNQETRRMSISAEVDERTLREIYLAAFETIVKKAQPWTMMCSYNCINGTYSCENDWLLNQVLRKEWGFQGLVMSDWGAMNNRVASLKAGLDLEMPSANGITDKEIVQAVKDGTLSIETLDLSVKRVLELVKKYLEGSKEGATYDLEEHHKLARKFANECAVLLKNEENILPLKETAKVAFIGEFAVSPRFQGGGSSHINSFKISNALEASREYKVNYAKGFSILKDELEEDLLKEAVALAKEAQVAVVFAGLPNHYESEGYDRTHLNLPACQNALIEEIIKVQPNTVVVMHNGAPVLMPWADKVKGILEVYLSGQAVGEATSDLLFGKTNPSGKLAETFPKSLQDNPSYLNFPGTNRTVEYKEGVFIGYRYYDAKEMEVLYPFGFGLSYTTFDYSDLGFKVIKGKPEGFHNNTDDHILEDCQPEVVSPEQDSNRNQKQPVRMKDTDHLQVTLKIKNTGKLFGKETIQLYVHDREASVIRPVKELKGFEKVALLPGEEKVVTFTLDQRSFAYYCTERNDWYAESGEYEIVIGKSSRDIVLTGTVLMESTAVNPFVIDDRTTFADAFSRLKDPTELLLMIKRAHGDTTTVEINPQEAKNMIAGVEGMPLHSLRSFSKYGVQIEEVEKLMESTLGV